MKKTILFIILILFVGRFSICLAQEDSSKINIDRISINLIDGSYKLNNVYRDSVSYKKIVKNIKIYSEYLSSRLVKVNSTEDNYDYLLSLDHNINEMESILSNFNYATDLKLEKMNDIKNDLKLKYEDLKNFGNLEDNPIKKIHFRIVIKNRDGTLVNNFKVRANFWVDRKNKNSRYTFNESKGPNVDAVLCVNEYDIWLEDESNPPNKIPFTRNNPYKIDSQLEGNDLVIQAN